MPRKKKQKYNFDDSAADRVVEFFETFLTHTEGRRWAGEPFRPEPWQRDYLRELFGWKRGDGTRKYRRTYVEIPRKNGKTTLAAGVALYLLFADGEPGARVFSAAADREQARLVFSTAKQMVQASPELSERATIYRDTIVVNGTSSTYKVLSADAFTKHGLNASAIIFDELHAQPNRDLWDVLTTSTGARDQPLIMAITTAGWNKHSICYEQHEYAERVADGSISDDSFLPRIYAADSDADWTDREVWLEANPNMGISVSEEYLAGEAKRAQEVPAYENTFRQLHLNQWTEQAVRWLPMDRWDDCAGKVGDLAGRVCWAGLDLSATRDLTAFVLVFPADDGSFDVVPHFFVPKESARERARRDKVPYQQWIDDGSIIATPGDTVDYSVVRDTIYDAADKYKLQLVAVDRWNATAIMQDLAREGVNVAPYGQGFASMSAPSKELERRILSGDIRHGGDPVLRWCAQNVAVETDAAENIKPTKGKSTERIDGIVALIMAIGLAMSEEQEQTTSYQVLAI